MKRMGRLACGSIRLGGLVPSSVVILPPVVLFAPIISGDVVPGVTLSSTDGVWSNSPTGYAYQWYRDGVAIVGATSATYVAVSADVGADITCRVVASNAGGSSAPSTSNTLTSPWYAPIVVTLTAGGATGYLWIKDVGISTAVGQPVALWEDVTGTASWEQPGVSSLCPILQSDGLVYDGIDDRMNAGAGLSALMTGNNWSIGVGFAAVVLSNGTLFWSITDGSTSNFIQVATNRRQLNFVPSALLFSLNSAPAPTSLWNTRSGADYTRRVGIVEESATSVAAYPSGLNTLTLGARRSPTLAGPMNGRIAWCALTNRTLSSAERADINTLLAANGYPA